MGTISQPKSTMSKITSQFVFEVEELPEDQYNLVEDLPTRICLLKHMCGLVKSLLHITSRVMVDSWKLPRAKDR